MIQQLISEKMPDQLKLSFALSTRNAVREQIKKRCGLEMPIQTVGEYLKRWGFTPQKPLRRAYEQKPERVEACLKDEQPYLLRVLGCESAQLSRHLS